MTKGTLGGGPALVQYWRSFDDLERFVRDPDAHHLPAWRAFNQRVRASGDVGIWHETYRVRAGEYEAIYGNMPRIGLAGAADHKPLEPKSTAAQRIRARQKLAIRIRFSGNNALAPVTKVASIKVKR